MLFVDDADIFGVSECALRKSLLDRIDTGSEERVADALFDQDVVRRDTGLAGIQELAPADAFGSELHINGRIDDRRTLSAELQRDGREVRRCLFHDEAADGRAPRKEDIVKGLLQKTGVFLASALDDGDIFRRENLGDQVRDDL